MFLRLTFNVYGENFSAKAFSEEFVSEKFLTDFDENFPHHLSFSHNKEFSNVYWDEPYEQDFYDLIVENIELLKQANATGFNLMIEVYKQNDEQCNFQILDKKFLKLIAKYDIDLPISVYTL